MADATLTLVKPSVVGNYRMITGFYTLSGTTGDIKTGLTHIEYFSCQSNANATAVYGTVSGGTISITAASSDTGYFIAIGE